MKSSNDDIDGITRFFVLMQTYNSRVCVFMVVVKTCV